MPRLVVGGMVGGMVGGSAVARVFGGLAWVVTGAGIVVTLVATRDGTGASGVVTWAMTGLACCLLAQLAATAAAWRERRPALLALFVGLVLWFTGSAVLAAQGRPETVTFPAPGEWFFLAGYVGFAGHLALDGVRASRVSLATWLDAIITCGGAAALAALVVVTPVQHGFGRQGVPLLVALAYPLLDVALWLFVIAQVVVRRRRADARAGATLLAFALLGTADTSLVTNLAAGTYRYGLLLDVCWAVAFLLLVGAACRAGSHPASRAGSRPVTGAGGATRDGGSWAVLAAGGAALLVLTVGPPPGVRPYTVVPAVVTLLATGLRLVLALRQARVAAEALRLSRTDDLTGLPNRRALDSWLARRLADGAPVGLLLLGLDGFKEVNDTLGHTAGDTVLQVVADRLRSAVRTPDRVARLGGDEFAVLTGQGDPERLGEAAQRLRGEVAGPARIDGIELHVDASVGAATRDEEVLTGGDLLRRADVAMSQAKESSLGVMLYDAARDDFSRTRLQFAEELRHGVERGELVVWYQPQVEAATGRPRSVEALVRWQHPVRGLLAPGAFLPAARRAGLMAMLTDAVLDDVVADAARWHAAGLDLSVSANVAPAELLNPGVVDRLLDAVTASGVTPGRIVVEVTEDSFLAEPERAREAIARLRLHGLEVSIDDYGTGYSSLSYLRDLPVQELKIDRAFAGQVVDDPRSRLIVTATHQLARGLGMRTVAEGVEDAATARVLDGIGVDLLQGYHYARPMPRDDVAGWLAAHGFAARPAEQGVSAPAR